MKPNRMQIDRMTGTSSPKLDLIQIDRSSDISIADQIAHQLLKNILHGNLDPGERLPPERELAEHLDISRGTVKRAYAKLVESKAIDMRQGSGSYVLKNGRVLEQNQKKQAAAIIASAFERLRGMGLSEREILNLVNLQSLGAARERGLEKIMIMVVSNNYAILSELEQQLSYLTDPSPFLFTLSYLTLDAIENSPSPAQMLRPYDLIIASSIDHPQLVELSPANRDKVLEASLSPRSRTLARLSALPADARIGLVYRTRVFRDMVLQSLLILGFDREQVLPFHELDYTPGHHDDHQIDAVITFNESPVYLDKAFAPHNRELADRGGVILRYEYQLERGALIRIEDQIQRLLQD